jgi:hypothetical protein
VSQYGTSVIPGRVSSPRVLGRAFLSDPQFFHGTERSHALSLGERYAPAGSVGTAGFEDQILQWELACHLYLVDTYVSSCLY